MDSAHDRRACRSSFGSATTADQGACLSSEEINCARKARPWKRCGFRTRRWRARTEEPEEGRRCASLGTRCWCRRSPPCARRAKRTLGQRSISTCALGGMVLHERQDCEMKNGGGNDAWWRRCPVYLNALARPRRSCRHGQRFTSPSATPSDFGQIYCLSRPQGRRHRPRGLDERASASKPTTANVTYGTKQRARVRLSARQHEVPSWRTWSTPPTSFAGLVDEVDSILVARRATPLIISRTARDRSDFYNSEIDTFHPQARKGRLRGRWWCGMFEQFGCCGWGCVEGRSGVLCLIWWVGLGGC